MQRICSIFLMVAIFLTALHNPAAAGDLYRKMCVAHESSMEFSLCNTYVDSTILTVCGHYSPKKDPLKPYTPAQESAMGVPEIHYVCDYETQSGERMIVCRGGASLPPTIVKAFAEKEFLDTQARCSRLCSPCSSGWEPLVLQE